jgi:Hydantoin racemase
LKLLVVNCNISSAVTEVIVHNAELAARPGTEIIGLKPTWGPESAEGFFESFVSAAAVLDAISTYEGPFDAVVMAGYGEHGREGARQLLEQPVVDITEASAQLACLVAHRFGVATTLTTTIAGIKDSLAIAGLADRCVGVLATDVPVGGIADDEAETVDALASVGAALMMLGADAIVLGCAGFAGLDRMLEARLGVPVFDSVTSAVVVAEALVSLGKRTSKSGPYAAPTRDKEWVGWPVSSGRLVARDEGLGANRP